MSGTHERIAERRGLIAAAVLSGFLTGTYYLLGDATERVEYWNTRLSYIDGAPHPYVQNAIEPFSATTAPWSRRILHTTIAYLLPFDAFTSFQIVTATAIAGTGILVYLVAREIEFSIGTALTGTAMYFTLAWAVDFLFKSFWIDEPLAFFLLTLGVYAILTDRTRLFVGVLAIGATEKTTILLLVPLFYTITANRLYERDRLVRTALYAIVPMAVLLFIRFTLPVTNDYSLWSQFLKIGLPRLQSISSGDLVRWFIAPFGVLVVFPLISLDEATPWLVRFSPLVAGTYGQLLVASNEQNLIVGAFPALIVMALFGVERVRESVVQLGSVPIPSVLFGTPFVIIALEQAATTTTRPSPLRVQLLVILVFTVGVALAMYTLDHLLNERILPLMENWTIARRFR